MRFTTAIFDMDGVVIDSERLFDEADSEFLTKHGATFDIKELALACAGMDVKDVVGYMQAQYGIKGKLKDLIAQRHSILVEHYRNHLRYMPGFQKFYQKVMKHGLKTCIATASYPELLKVVDETLGIRELFNNKLFTISEVGHKSKPDPAIFLYAAKQMDATPGECFVIEDSPKGLRAAKNAGIYCIGITTTFSQDKLLGADRVVDKFSEIHLAEL